ncbi:helix-turn-helix transcriptional regulator [Taibaiella koreensis]|uniref:helix-turn-helix transcriptional regulator n=1 Tax=Taibaiella koreensis TaxID=1268548 RepID=UPI000E59BB7A|nr:WYL domain-containing protein [Taibaiella koreensis]
MSLSDTYFRHQCMIRRLLKAPASLQELKDYYELECETHDYNFIFSQRTFLRDKEEILSLHKKDIQYNPSLRKYYLEEDHMPDDLGERIADAYNTYQALNLADGLSDFVYLEKRRPQGMEHFHPLLHAIRSRLVVTFQYEKYLDENISERRVEPLALKEFQSRWYLLAKDLKDHSLKTFALDRMTALETSRQKYKADKGFNVNDYFRHCFGIIRPSAPESKPQDIVLQFGPGKGKYIKSLPLHESQRVIKDDEEGLQVALELYITHDLIMELLSHGADVTVLQPASLRKTLNEIYNRAEKIYQH